MKISWYKEIQNLVRLIHEKSCDALKLSYDGEQKAIETTKKYIEDDYSKLKELWVKELKIGDLSDLSRHIHFSETNDYENIVKYDLPLLDKMAEEHALGTDENNGFEELLHP